MKKLLPLFIFTIFSFGLSGQQVTNPKSGKSFINSALSGSDKSWINTQNAATSDNQYATFGNLSDYKGSYTDYLITTDFGFSISSSSEIRGIAVYVESSDPNASTADYNIRIVKEETIGANEHSTGELYLNGDSADSYRTYGSDGDLWGEHWTPADINSAAFGVAISAQRAITGTTTAGRIDNIRISIYYFDSASLPQFLTLPLNLKSFSAVSQKEQVRLTWTTNDESGMDRFEIQRAAEGGDFKSFGSILCRNQSSVSNYSFTDYAPYQGTSSYRLKILEKSGAVKCSKIANVNFKTDNVNTLYPSPWKKGQGLFIRNAANEKLNIEFYDNSGVLISRLSASSGQVASETLINAKGILRYKVFNSKNELTGSGSLLIY